MIRPLLLSAVLAISACKSSPPGLSTIEEGEAYAQAHGVVLTDKKEDRDQAVANRVYDYKANGSVHFSILQFNSETAGAEWKKMLDASPLAPETRLQKGSVVLMIATHDASDADRQKVIDALK